MKVLTKWGVLLSCLCVTHSMADVPFGPSLPNITPGQAGNPALPGQTGQPNLVYSLGTNFGRADCNADVQKSSYPPNGKYLPFPTQIFSQNQSNQITPSSVLYLITRQELSGNTMSCPPTAATNQNNVLGGANPAFTVGNTAQPQLYYPAITIGDLVPVREVCVENGRNVNYALCLYATATSAPTQVGGYTYSFSGAQLNYQVDTRLPPEVSISKIGLGDSRLTVYITNSTGSNYNYQVCYTSQGESQLSENDACSGEGFTLSPTTSSPITLKNLTNGTSYFLKARAFINQDSAGKWSAIRSAEPVQGLTPMGVYDGAPNSTQFSCASSSQNPYAAAWVLLLLAFLFQIRRGRST